MRIVGGRGDDGEVEVQTDARALSFACPGHSFSLESSATLDVEDCGLRVEVEG